MNVYNNSYSAQRQFALKHLPHDDEVNAFFDRLISKCLLPFLLTFCLSLSSTMLCCNYSVVQDRIYNI